MKNTLLIIQREYFTEVRKKSFIIMTLLAPLLIAGLIAFLVLMIKVNETQAHLGVIDETTLFIQDFKSNEDLNIHRLLPKDLQEVKDTLAQSKTLDALLYIPKITDSSLQNIEKDVVLFTNKNISKSSINDLSSIINKKIKETRRKQLNITEKDVKALSPNTNFTINNLKNNTKEKDNDVRYFLALFLMYITMMFIIINGVKVMRSVLEEKNNRVVEIIISSVKPFELMLGKILGTALVALTQMGIWIIMFLILFIIAPMILGMPSDMAELQQIRPEQITQAQHMAFNLQEIYATINNLNIPIIIFIFLFYFSFGYLLYSAFFAAIGSAVDNETETQQFTMLAVIPLTLGAYGCFSIINNPEGPAAFWLSIIPITSPLAMVTRSTFEIPLWELLLSMLILLGSVFGMIYLAAKIYSTGILMYGKKVNLKELWKWIRI